MIVLLPVLVASWAAVVSASPRNIVARGQGQNDSRGGPPGYSHDDSWGSKSGGWGDSSQHDGSWDHSSTAGHPGSQYGGTDGGGWGYSSTCEASTIVETSTVAGSASTVYVSGSGYTETLPASTVYISGSGYTTTISASTVYVSGSDYTSYAPASTLTLAGPAITSYLTISGTITQPASPTTVFITRTGLGWNHTLTCEETDFLTTTQRETSTVYNEETTTATSIVTLPGKSSRSQPERFVLIFSTYRHDRYSLRDLHQRLHSHFGIYGAR
jgi:hypothetical protein